MFSTLIIEMFLEHQIIRMISKEHLILKTEKKKILIELFLLDLFLFL